MRTEGGELLPCLCLLQIPVNGRDRLTPGPLLEISFRLGEIREHCDIHSHQRLLELLHSRRRELKVKVLQDPVSSRHSSYSLRTLQDEIKLVDVIDSNLCNRLGLSASQLASFLAKLTCNRNRVPAHGNAVWPGSYWTS
jgi:hypothetical protein